MKHVFYTWLLAVVLHPLLLRLIIMGRLDISFGEDAQLLLLSFVFSVPSFLLCLLAITSVTRQNTKPILRFLTWLSVAPASVLCILFVVLVWFGSVNEFFNAVSIVFPGCLAAALAVLIRYKQFFQLIKQTSANAQ